ncbi:MAG TPA: DNA polymerase III subunit alpha [Candidatus Angelobacter sp.]|jgi:error-prone DNA polymerase|nr:DNA polymerase III subunit alpha [Candidatus Angelobacter sp.]
MSSGWAELAARSHCSFLEGASSPAELVRTAAALGMPALGLCDRNGLYGAVELIQAARQEGVHPVVGAELDLPDGDRLRLLAAGIEGYRNLSRAISAAQLAGDKAHPLLDLFGDADNPDPNLKLPHRRRQFEPPPARPLSLRPTAGPFPEGWPGLPSTRELPQGPPARVDPQELRGCLVLAGGRQSAITDALLAGEDRVARRHLDRLREAFGAGNVGLLLSHHLHPADTWLAGETALLAERCGVRLVATNLPVHATPGSKSLLDVLTAIRHRTTLDGASAHGLLLANTQHRIKSEHELRELLDRYPHAFEGAAEMAARCHVSLDFSDVRFPGFPVPPGETPFSLLYKLCHDAVPRRYHPVTREVAARLQRELEVIEKTGLAEFFLITWDIMRFAREQGIPGQGRGSAADSIVAYLLGVTRVDPVEHNLLFERFLHEEYTGTPDIDIDFSTDHREQVLRYVYDKYGEERTGMVANVVTYRPRMAIRQVGAAMGFPETIVDRLAKSVNGWYEGTVDDALTAAGLDRATHRHALPWEQFKEVLHAIEGTPRHLGIHVGGMLVTGRPLVEVAPVERATMPGRVVVQFDKDDVEDLGLIKMDLLGLRTLSVIHECLELVEQTHGVRPDLDALPLDDARVYDMICAPDTIGLFQIESRAQQQSLYQSQPREFNDLIVQVAIIRPGPIQGNAVNPYLRRRQGLEPVTYAHPSLEPILAETRGVILYQEQILRIVMEVAGYTPGEADRFRRAMNRHRSRVEMQSLHDEFVQRCMGPGLDEATAEQIFSAAAGFAQFGFCKSHAAAFARTAYETAWLKLEHPAHWLCALLNAQPMGFYHPSVLVEDGKRHGVRTLPVDVTRSRARCTLEPAGDRSRTVGERAAQRAVVGGREQAHAVRLGFNYVRGLGPTGRAVCEEAVLAGANGSTAEFWRATRLQRPAMENLVMVGAFDAVAGGKTRRELLWELREVEDSLPPRAARASLGAGLRAGPQSAPPRGRGLAKPRGTKLPEERQPTLLDAPAPAPPLPELDERERVAAEYRLSELSTGPHLLAFLRHRLDELGCTPLARAHDLQDKQRTRVAGLVIVRQAPSSASGFRFFTLADEGGHLDLVLRPKVYQRVRNVANFHPLLLVDGVIEAEGGRLNLLVEQVRALDGDGHVTPPVDELPGSHDYR